MLCSRNIWICCLLLALPLAAATLLPGRKSQATTLTIATWNLEWLVSPETAHTARLACRAAQRATLPCDVVREHSRDSADVGRLAAYAQQLDADIIAFQEVEDAATAQRVFRGYDICIASGPGVQHVGFAVRHTVAHRCGPAMEALMLGARNRAGQSLFVAPDSPAQIELLAVHLKSGCARDDLEAGPDACHTLAAQAKQLGTWIALRAANHTRFIVLGDFNRNPPGAADNRFWELLGSHDEEQMPFVHAAAGNAFRNCQVGQPFAQFIDHILIGQALVPQLLPGSFHKTGYTNLDALRYRLSDHCPVSISLRSELPIYKD
jgi:endonuclease/exonuclease/phosphatase family metal-dependent hydrolase